MHIAVNDKGADYANPNVKLDVLKAQGCKYVCRYIDGTAATRNPTWKVLTKSERARIGKAGLGLILVFEISTTRPLGGAVNGTIDGKAALKDAYFLAYDPKFPIVVAIDTDVQDRKSTRLNSSHT